MPGPSFTISRNGTKKPVGRPKPTSLQSPLAHFPPRCTPELTVHLTPRAARRHCDCETSEQRSMVLTGRSAGRFMVMDTRCVCMHGADEFNGASFFLGPCRAISFMALPHHKRSSRNERKNLAKSTITIGISMGIVAQQAAPSSSENLPRDSRASACSFLPPLAWPRCRRGRKHHRQSQACARP